MPRMCLKEANAQKKQEQRISIRMLHQKKIK